MRRNSNGNLCDRNGVALCHKAVIDKLRRELGLGDCVVEAPIASGHFAPTFESVARLLATTEMTYREVSHACGISVDSVRTYAKWLRKGGVPFAKRDSWTGYRTSNPARFRP